MRKQRLSNDLHISNFIKDPENLKLLILAGTEVQKSEFSTIKKCVNLIKLDLSNNGLKTLPIPLQQFTSLKLLFLHDNHFEHLDQLNIEDCHTEYITLFNNPIRDYRRNLLSYLPNVRAIDKNVVSDWERRAHTQMRTFKRCTDISWPLVELEKDLDNENDYLSLLKGQLLVLNDAYFQTVYTGMFQQYIRGIISLRRVEQQLNCLEQKSKRKQNLIARVASQWKSYTAKRVQLRFYLVQQGKQPLVYNKIEYNRFLRSEEANRVIANYVRYIRGLVIAKRLLKRNISEYSRMVKTRKSLQQQLAPPYKFFIKESQFQTVNKMFLYIKKILFSRKRYELCQDFDNIMHRTGRVYTILVERQFSDRDAMLLEEANRLINSILVKDPQSKRQKLYNRRGHIRILKVNQTPKPLTEDQTIKLNATHQKLVARYAKYDKLCEWQTVDQQIFNHFMKLIRFYNAGNTSKILKNTTAYFQTEVAEEEVHPLRDHKIHIFHPQLVERSVAATKIQSFFRRIKVQGQYRTIHLINKERAARRIQKWSRGLLFKHRGRFIQDFSFYQKSLSASTYYIQLVAYMNLPTPRNTLRFQMDQPTRFLPYQNTNRFTDLYQIIHKDAKIRTVHLNDQTWIKVEFPSVSEAVKRIKLLRVLSYRLFSFSYIRLFKLQECGQVHDEYYEILEKVYNISMGQRHHRIRNQLMDNTCSAFLFERGEQQTVPRLQNLKTKIVDMDLEMFVFSQARKGLKIKRNIGLLIHHNIYLEHQLSPIPPKQQRQFLLTKPRYSTPIILEEIPKTKRNNLRELMPTRNQPRRPKEHYLNRNKSKSFARMDDSLHLPSLKLISETMPFRKR